MKGKLQYCQVSVQNPVGKWSYISICKNLYSPYYIRDGLKSSGSRLSFDWYSSGVVSVCSLIPATHGNFFILSPSPPVPWSSGGLQILSGERSTAKPASLAPVHHMCTQAAEHQASCSPTIMLSDDGWLHIRCLNWRAAPSGKWFGKSGLAWWMGKVTMPISVTPAASLLPAQQPQSSISHWFTFSIPLSLYWDLLSLNCH